LLTEAQKGDYFVDGFLLKHLHVWPATLDRNNLFEQQKIFLVYLLGIIPEYQDWQIQTEYQKGYKAITAIKEIELDKTEIDLARMQGKDIEKIKKEKLYIEKTQRIQELNKKFGIKEENPETGRVKIPGHDPVNNNSQKEQLWDILHGKGIIKKTGGDNGLQH
jgi:hypothetical protein